MVKGFILHMITFNDAGTLLLNDNILIRLGGTDKNGKMDLKRVSNVRIGIASDRGD
jgi:hypothetical protein